MYLSKAQLSLRKDASSKLTVLHNNPTLRTNTLDKYFQNDCWKVVEIFEF